jgi:hypothetical protein
MRRQRPSVEVLWRNIEEHMHWRTQGGHDPCDFPGSRQQQSKPSTSSCASRPQDDGSVHKASVYGFKLFQWRHLGFIDPEKSAVDDRRFPGYLVLIYTLDQISAGPYSDRSPGRYKVFSRFPLIASYIDGLSIALEVLRVR